MDKETLEMALVGYRQQVDALSVKITEIEKELRAPAKSIGRPPKAVKEQPKQKRKMTANGRAAIRAAVKRRWAAVKAAKKAA